MPTLRGAAAAATAAAATSQSVSNPSWSGSATPPGDVIVLWCSTFNASVTFSCTGFTARPSATNSRSSSQLLYRISNGSEGATFSVSSSASVEFGVVAISYFNENQPVPFDPFPPSSGFVSSSQSTTLSNSGITTGVPGDVLIWFGATFGPITPAAITVPAGYTAQVTQANSGTAGGAAGVIVATSSQASSGATGAVNGSAAFTSYFSTALIGIPAPLSQGSYVAQSGPRPKFAPKLRRGVQFAPPMPQANQGTIFPLFTRQFHQPHRWNYRLPRGRQYAPVPPQGNQGVQFPLFTKPPGRRPRFEYKQRYGKNFAPVPPQGVQGVQFPLFTRQYGGVLPRWLPRLRRGAFFLPGWGQAGDNPPATVLHRQPGVRPRWLPPSRVTSGRVFQPGWGQAGQGVKFPLFTRQSARPPQWVQLMRNRPTRFDVVPYVPQVRIAAVHWTGTGSWSASAILGRNAAARWSGAGSMRIAGVRQTFGAASWSASGRMTFVQAVVSKNASLSLSGSGNMSLSGTPTRVGVMSMQGSGSMSITAAEYPGLRMQGAGRMTVGAQVTQQGALVMAGAGRMQVSASSAPPDRLVKIEPGAVDSPAAVIATGTWQQRELADQASEVFVTEVDDGQFDEPDE